MKKKLTCLLAMAALSLLTACHSHVYKEATCTDPEICEECGETREEALGHYWLTASCDKPDTCSRCGETRGEALGHSYSEASCEEGEVCTRCGSKGRTALGHDWQAATCTQSKTCKRCGKTEGKAAAHSYSAGSCTEDKVCLACGDKIKAPGHNWLVATCTEAATCKACGEVQGEALGHNMNGLNCTRCSFTLATLEEMARVCSLKATCETDIEACLVDTENSHNPYDVIWDYGEEYQRYVDACDWSRVFDVEYYKKTFPMLAVQYHDDDALLLEHFQTVGIHEGRQGSESFNVNAYYRNADNTLRETFEKNWAAYYLYYMLHYDKERSVNTITDNNGKTIYKQMKMVATIMQATEHKHVNQYREEVGADPVTFDPELAAFANFRAYLNAHDGYKAHDWAENDTERARDYLNKLGNWQGFAENTVTHYSSRYHDDWAYKYRNSEKHYKAMVNTRYNYGGYSNAYYVKGLTSQFDVFIVSLDTAMHPEE